MLLPDIVHPDEATGEFFIDFNDSAADNGSGDGGGECFALWSQFFLVRDLWLYVGCTVLALGSVGHPLTVIVVLGNAGMRRLPLSVYLVTMSLAGMTSLYSELLPVVIDYWSCYRVSLKNLTTETGCRTLSAVAHWSAQLYAWTEALFAAERLIATRWPLRYNALCSRRRNVAVVCACAAALAALNGAFHFYAHGYGASGFCEPINLYLYNRVWSYTHLVVSALAPIFAMTALNAATVHTLRAPSLFASGAKRRAESATALMIALNAVFVVTSVPELVVEWEETTRALFDDIELAGVTCRLVKHAGVACVVFVYVCIGSKFRAALLELVCCRRRCALTAAAAAAEPGLSAAAERGGGQIGSARRRPVSTAAPCRADSDCPDY